MTSQKHCEKQKQKFSSFFFFFFTKNDFLLDLWLKSDLLSICTDFKSIVAYHKPNCHAYVLPAAYHIKIQILELDDKLS